jgi:predicted DNA-binding WGR domain protein
MKYEFIGWCRDEEKNQDKVWICIHLSGSRMNPMDYNHLTWGAQGKYLTVWGRRGKKLQHKVVEAVGYEMLKLINAKRSKGYALVDKTELDLVYPEFQEDLEKTAAWGLLLS